MKTLHLNLKGKWFDMFISGEKKEEYREITEYWKNRLQEYIPATGWMNGSYWESNGGFYQFKNFDTITFSNGYSKDRRQFVIELQYIEIGIGKKEWGAQPNQKYFILKTGAILSKNF